MLMKELESFGGGSGGVWRFGRRVEVRISFGAVAGSGQVRVGPGWVVVVSLGQGSIRAICFCFLRFPVAVAPSFSSIAIVLVCVCVAGAWRIET